MTSKNFFATLDGGSAYVDLFSSQFVKGQQSLSFHKSRIERHFLPRFLGINSSLLGLDFLSDFSYPLFSVLQNAFHEKTRVSCFADFQNQIRVWFSWLAGPLRV
jgi:hypothetical protein